MNGKKNAFSQPAVAGGYVPVTQTTSTYSDTVFGCKCIVNGGNGLFFVTLDEAIEDARYLVVATPVQPAGGVACTAQLDGAPTSTQFEITTLNAAGAAIDAGVMFAVFQIPKTV